MNRKHLISAACLVSLLGITQCKTTLSEKEYEQIKKKAESYCNEEIIPALLRKYASEGQSGEYSKLHDEMIGKIRAYINNLCKHFSDEKKCLQKQSDYERCLEAATKGRQQADKEASRRFKKIKKMHKLLDQEKTEVL